MPERIQLRRTAGWRKPADAIVVARPSKWGNPFRLRDRTYGLVHFRPAEPDDIDWECRISADGTRHDWWGPDGQVVEYQVRWATQAEIAWLFERTLTAPTQSMRHGAPSRRGFLAQCTVEDVRLQLAGHDLACWCPLDQPCHADVLLRLANETEAPA